MPATTAPLPEPTGLVGRIARFSLRHRKLVIGIWIALLVIGGSAAGSVSKRLSLDFSLPGQPGYVAAHTIVQQYGNGGDNNPAILAVSEPAGATPAGVEATAARAFSSLRAEFPTLRILDYGSTRDTAFLTNAGTGQWALVLVPPQTSFSGHSVIDRVPDALGATLPAGYHSGITGLNQLSTSTNSKGNSILSETLLGGLGALIVLLFVFGSLLALVPLIVAAMSITTTFVIVLGLTYVTEISFVVEFLIALVGLGVAIDYSLLYVTRWREERHRGRDNRVAVMIAAETAGRAVVFSGLTVGISLLSMVVLPVPSMRSIGLGGMLIPVLSVAVTLTVLPAILGGIGPRFDWPRIRHESAASRPWSAWARGLVRVRWGAAIAGVAVLAILISPFFSLKIGLTSPDALAKGGPARVTYDQLRSDGVPAGMLTPLEVLVDRRDAPAAVAVLKSVPGIATAAASTAADANRGTTTVVDAIPVDANVNSSSSQVVTRARAALAHIPGVIGVAGIGATQIDFVHAVFGHFPLMFSIIAILTLILLARAFKSVLLPIKAIVFNVASLSATFGFVAWFWQQGHGSHAVFGVPATGAITFWIPLMIFAFLFGLSMDYEVFILARMREEYDRSGSTDEAVVTGLARTGRLVTSAALILFLAFASLASAGFTDLKVFATALGVGILLDATIVRALLLPALVSLFGEWNWWMPAWLARVLVIREGTGIHGSAISELAEHPLDGEAAVSGATA